MDRLDRHKDNWREVELQVDLGVELPPADSTNLKVIIYLKTLPLMFSKLILLL